MSEEYPIPTPCKLDIGSGWIVDGNGQALVRMPATCVTQAWENRAHFIIDAVNDRAELIAIIKAYNVAADKFINKCETGRARSTETQADLRACREMARAVLNPHRRTQNENGKGD